MAQRFKPAPQLVETMNCMMGTLDILPTYVAHLHAGASLRAARRLQRGALHSERREESRVGAPAARLQGWRRRQQPASEILPRFPFFFVHMGGNEFDSRGAFRMDDA